MSEPVKDGARVGFPPPLLYLVGIGVGVGVHFFVDDHFALATTWRLVGGAMASALGVFFMVGAIIKFRATGQDPKPWKPSPEIITDGIYRITRNPMYVAMALLQTAVAIAAANVWIAATLPIVLVAVYVIAIRHEEVYLAAKFGQPYLDYTARVRRWI